MDAIILKNQKKENKMNKYGIPYQGSKNQIADWIINLLIDLFTLIRIEDVENI